MKPVRKGRKMAMNVPHPAGRLSLPIGRGVWRLCAQRPIRASIGDNSTEVSSKQPDGVTRTHLVYADVYTYTNLNGSADAGVYAFTRQLSQEAISGFRGQR